MSEGRFLSQTTKYSSSRIAGGHYCRQLNLCSVNTSQCCSISSCIDSLSQLSIQLFASHLRVRSTLLRLLQRTQVISTFVVSSSPKKKCFPLVSKNTMLVMQCIFSGYGTCIKLYVTWISKNPRLLAIAIETHIWTTKFLE